MNSKTFWRLVACTLFLLGSYNAWLLAMALSRPTRPDFWLACSVGIFTMGAEFTAYQYLRYHQSYTGNRQLKMVAIGTGLLVLSVVHALVCSFGPVASLSMVRLAVGFLPLALPLVPFEKRQLRLIR